MSSPASKPSPATKGKGGRQKATDAAAEKTWITNDQRQKINTTLLDWYDRNHRVLPWRRTPHSKRSPALDPGGPSPAPDSLEPQAFAYRVWVSEIMLQQTQVATVIPYFNKWIDKWPTAKALAAASIEEVNTMWAGLGYYRRARYLLDGAKAVVDKLDGLFPTTAKELLAIPGVGPYTAAAIGSIAFNDPSAVVDGNVIRVVSRLCALEGDPTKLGAAHTAIAQQMLDTSRPGCFNQAVMELGATVCRPVNPDCSGCPVNHSCAAYKAWTDYLGAGGAPDIEDAPVVTRFPGKKPVKAKREAALAVCVLEVMAPAGSLPGSATGVTPCPSEAAAAGKDTAAKAQPAAKKQRTMFDFAVKAAASKDSQAAAAAGGSAAKAGPQERLYLLVQRPEGGLLGGLWEFPGTELPSTSSCGEEEQRQAGAGAKPLALAQRQALTDSLLERLFGEPLVSGKEGSSSEGLAARAGLKVLGRFDVGEYVHVFSHIRQTSYVERLSVKVDDFAPLQEAAARAAASAAASAGPSSARKNSEASASKTKAGAKAKAKAGGAKGKGKRAASNGEDGSSGSEAEGEEGAATAGMYGAVQWVRESDIEGDGLALTTGPKKIFKLACGSSSSKGKGGKGK